MDLKQADMLLIYLESKSFIIRSNVYERTNDVVIHYNNGKREEVLSIMSKFSFEDKKLAAMIPISNSRKLSRDFFDRLVSLLVTKFVRDIFIPKPISTIITVVHAVPFIVRAVKNLFKGKLTVEVLDGISIGTSIVRADFSTASSVMLLLNIGKLLEEWTYRKSLDDLVRSMQLNVDKVWLVTNGTEVQVPISTVKTGDIVRVNAGNIIPIDGTVEKGNAMVNQASLTGESVPVHKKKNTSVYAGTVIEEGSILIKVKSEAGQGRYDKMVAMIEESEKLKSNAEAKYSRIADKLVPYSLLGTGLTYLFTRNITRAVSVLMVDFSCALKLAMPLSVLSAMREASFHGVRVKGGKALEKLAEADTIVLDKTGTLTKACPTVANVIACHGEKEEEMIRIAACLEEHFPHSMANAVVKKAADMGIIHNEMHSKVNYIVAHGISTTIDVKYLNKHRENKLSNGNGNDIKVIIGSRHFVFEDEKTEIAKEDEGILDELKPEFSYLFLAIGGKLSAIICIHDPLRDEAKLVLEELKKLGIKKTVMITGDNEKTARSIAEQVGIDEFYAEVLPDEKADYIRNERKKGNKVIMIGDGINDSLALSEADCGIAISEGAAIAREVADVTISGNNLMELVVLKLIANRLMERIHNNYNFIIGYNASLILLGTLGILPPKISALLHNTATIGISLSSMGNLIESEE
jgi:heavy metal translocating P-type ATPase